MRYITKTALRLVAIMAIIALGFWSTAGLSGEVFLVSPEGKPESAPGAEVHIYRCDDKHSLQAFLATVNLLQSWKEIEAKLPATRLESSEHRMHTVQNFLYMDIFVKVSQ